MLLEMKALAWLILAYAVYAKEIEMVVSRYAEPLDWLASEPFVADRYVIYNKGINPIECPAGTDCYVEQVDNVGRCDHTYLHHIISRYNNLADVTVFLPGSVDAELKYKWSRKVMKQVHETQNTVFARAFSVDIVTRFEDYEKTGSYICNNAANRELNPDFVLQPCSVRPFGNWYRKNFPDQPVYGFQMYGVFAVAREHIVQHPIDYYKKLISYVDHHHNPEAGFFFEVGWGAVFSPFPEELLVPCTTKDEFFYFRCDSDIPSSLTSDDASVASFSSPGATLILALLMLVSLI